MTSFKTLPYFGKISVSLKYTSALKASCSKIGKLNIFWGLYVLEKLNPATNNKIEANLYSKRLKTQDRNLLVLNFHLRKWDLDEVGAAH
jgi:hypothetical protein